MPRGNSRITTIILSAFFVALLAYGAYEFRGIVFGPRIQLYTTSQSTSTEAIHIVGRADRIAALTMNGAAVAVSEHGEFQETYLLAPGLNRIVFDARDTYGQEAHEVLTMVYTPAATPTPTEVR